MLFNLFIINKLHPYISPKFGRGAPIGRHRIYQLAIFQKRVQYPRVFIYTLMIELKFFQKKFF